MAEILRIAVDNVTLEVNDNGDTIVLPLGDERFVQRVYDYANQMQEGAKELDAARNTDDIAYIVGANIDFHTKLKDNFNFVFGERAYEKVFGDDIVVGVDYIVMFLEQIMPYIEKHQKKRTERLSKYSADRVGSSM